MQTPRIRGTGSTVTAVRLTGKDEHTWIGPDERGRQLSLVGIDRPGCVLSVLAPFLIRTRPKLGDTCFRLGKGTRPGRPR